MRALRADRCISAVAGVDVCVVGEREQALSNAGDDPLEADGIVVRIAWAAGEERVASKQVLANQEAGRSGCVARRVDGLQKKWPKHKALLVDEQRVGFHAG